MVVAAAEAVALVRAVVQMLLWLLMEALLGVLVLVPVVGEQERTPGT